tara:strand:+ start:76 stop:264 length:189 start_codon:yes stop_codon:yes gene_type:complete
MKKISFILLMVMGFSTVVFSQTTEYTYTLEENYNWQGFAVTPEEPTDALEFFSPILENLNIV